MHQDVYCDMSFDDSDSLFRFKKNFGECGHIKKIFFKSDIKKI